MFQVELTCEGSGEVTKYAVIESAMILLARTEMTCQVCGFHKLIVTSIVPVE